jgi:hypothetical protein
MKRTNVILDEELLELARKASGEKTYSATINQALKEFVRVARLTRAINEMHGVGDEAFAPGFLEDYERRHPGVVWPKGIVSKKRVAAHERRLPKSTSKRRGSR